MLLPGKCSGFRRVSFHSNVRWQEHCVYRSVRLISSGFFLCLYGSYRADAGIAWEHRKGGRTVINAL